MEGRNLALEDMIIVDITCQKRKKEQEMAAQFRDIKERSVGNKYLKEVLEDYELYYRTLIEQKQKQQAALENILTHLELINQGQQRNLTQVSEDAVEQRHLLAEISRVKGEIDELLTTLDE